jgi:hypothetical protein
MAMSPRLLRPLASAGNRFRSLRQGLIVYLPLNETATSGDVTAEDWTKRGNNFTSNNSVLSTTGISGNARQFVGANSEYLSASYTDDLKWKEENFTVTWWYLIPSGATNTGSHLVSSDANSPRDTHVVVNTSGSRPVAWLRMTDNFEQGPLNFGTTGTPGADTWYFCAFRKNGTALTLRWQGSVTSTTQQAGKSLGSPGTTTSFFLGARTGVSQFLTGSIDEFCKWNRALSDAELDTLYNNGAGIDLRQ